MKHLKKKSKTNTTTNIKPDKTIALITDFGLQDQYVAAMKGVIVSINPKAKIIDITHQVFPHRIRQAGFLLWSVYKYFPKGTIFVSVVDPAVGSNRCIAAIKTKQHIFIAPDNGLLDFILYEEKSVEEIELTQTKIRKFIGQNISSTFHGRDIFAPIAAYLSNGQSLKDIGDVRVHRPVISPFVSSRTDNNHIGILHIDHFGNIITNLFAKDYDQISKEIQAVSVGRNLVSKWVRFYSESPEKTPCLLVGSNGLVEISVPNNNAAHLLTATLDTSLKVYWR